MSIWRNENGVVVGTADYDNVLLIQALAADESTFFVRLNANDGLDIIIEQLKLLVHKLEERFENGTKEEKA